MILELGMGKEETHRKNFQWNWLLGEKYSLCKENIDINRNLLFGEMHTNFVQTYGFEQGGIKLVNLLCFLNDMLVGWN